MSLELFANNVSTLLTETIAPGDTTVTITVGTGADFPSYTGGNFSRGVITSGTAPGTVYEYIEITGVSGDTLTIVRGQEGSTALDWHVGDILFLTATADTYASLAPLNSPALTGVPTAPTAPSGTNTTQLATTAFVHGWVLPSGTRLVFAQASAPTGWTQVIDDTANNRMLRVVNGYGSGTGGTYDPTYNNVVPAHLHSYSTTTGGESANHIHSMNFTTGGDSPDHTHYVDAQDTNHSDTLGYIAGNGYLGAAATPILSHGVTNSHYHPVVGDTYGNSADHTHFVSGNTDYNAGGTVWYPRYLDTIVCQKD